MKINIDRLHKQPKVGRGSGKTFDMVVELMQNVYLSKSGDIFVIHISYRNRVVHILKMIKDLCSNFDLEINSINKSKLEISFKHFDSTDLGVVIFALPDTELHGLKCADFFSLD